MVYNRCRFAALLAFDNSLADLIAVKNYPAEPLPRSQPIQPVYGIVPLAEAVRFAALLRLSIIGFGASPHLESRDRRS